MRAAAIVMFFVFAGIAVAGCKPGTDTSANKSNAAGNFANPASGKCPVSGDAIDPTITAVVDGKTYAFCCKDCVADFRADPDKFLKGGPTGMPKHNDNKGHDHGPH